MFSVLKGTLLFREKEIKIETVAFFAETIVQNQDQSNFLDDIIYRMYECSEYDSPKIVHRKAYKATVYGKKLTSQPMWHEWTKKEVQK